MKRKFILFLAGLFPLFAAFSQIPAGYYNAASSKSGDVLRSALRDITTSGSVKIPYTSSSFDIWDAYAVTDTRPGNNTIIWDMYSDIPSGSPLYNYTLYSQQCGTSGAEGDCYAREHQFPNSWWGGLDDPQNPQYSDLHHLPPADQYVNNRKSAHPIGKISIPTWTSTNGSKVGPCSWPGYTGIVFEPIDEYKGDFARAYLYIATRYMNNLKSWVINNPGTEALYIIDTAGVGNFKQWFMNMLVNWCETDPVSQKETERNDAIYYNTPQHNRNPYIDHPEYVCLVWSSASCTSAPAITSVTQNPVSPGMLNTVSVTATVTATAPLSSVYLDWGTDGINFPNNIIMNLLSGSDYITATPIPAQPTGTTVYYRITAQDNLTNSTTSGNYSYAVLKEEPTNHPSGFACMNITASTITLNWSDATGINIPDGYLVKTSAISLADITDPSDNVPETNGSFTKNVSPGTQQVVFTGLASSTPYYFKIYAYTNTGTNINYKTVPAVLSTSCTTAVSSGITCATDLVISEYVEGSSSNKYIELYNATGATVDLSNYRLRLFSNGASTPTSDIQLSGVLNNLSTIVYKNASAIVYTGTATNNSAVNFNGDDAITLYKISTASYVDIFGRIGEQPTSSWTNGTFTTINKTLVRNQDVTAGVSTNPVSGFPTLSTQWTQYNTDVVSNLGIHSITCASCSSPSQATGSISFSSTGETSMTVNWVNGNGSKRLVVVKDGSAVTGTPANGTAYLANPSFGSGDILNAGEFVVYDNNGSSVSISNLTGGHTYFITIFEYNCVPGSQIYLIPGTSASRSTYSITTGTVHESPYCITATSGFTSSVDITSTGIFSSNTYSVELSDANGSFASPFVIGTQTSNLNSETVNFTIPANTASGTGYRVRVLSSNPAITGSICNAFEIILSPLAIAPSAVTSDRSGFCSNDPGDITLTATGGSGTVLSWYSGTCGGTYIGTGNPLVIASPLSTTTYYARWGNTCSTSPCTSVTVSVSGLPTASAGSSISNCNGPVSILMTGASSSGGVNTWSGGSGLGTWTQNSNPALASFSPSVPAGSFIATLTVFSTSGCTDLSASYTRTISWGTAGYWTGASSTDWFTAANWCGGVPTSSTSIVIPASSQVIYSPVISNNFATCQNITLAGILDFGNNFNLDVNGNWTNNGGILNNSTGSITFRGTNKTIGGTGNTNFPVIKLSPGCSYSMNNNNSCSSLTFNSGNTSSSLVMGSTSSLIVNGNVTINSPANSGTNTWNINASNVTVTGNVTLGSGTSNSSRISKIVVSSGSFTVDGNLLYNVGNSLSGVVDLSGGAATFNLAGNITRNSAGSILPGTLSTVNYNGSLAGQTVTIGSGITYHHLLLNNSSVSGVVLGSAISSSNMTGNLSVQSGIFGNNGFGINGNATKQFSVANGATYRLGGSTSMPTGFGTTSLGVASTVDFNGSLTQTINGLNYGNLTSSGTGARIFSTLATISIAGTFNPGSNSFTATSSAVNFNGNNQAIPAINSANGYNNLYIAQNAGDAVATGNITVSGTLNLINGNFNIGSTILSLKGNSPVSGGIFSSSRMIIADGGGEIRKYSSATGSFLFPVGDNFNTADYSPVTVNYTSGIFNAGAYTSIKVNNEKHPMNANSTDYLDRYWTIANSGISNPVYNVEATYLSSDISGSDLGISMGSYGNTLPWNRYGAANTALKTITANGLTVTGSSSFSGINSSGPVINMPGSIAICNGQSVTINSSVTGTAPFIYSWSPATGLSQANIADPVADPAATTTYTLTVTDANGFISSNNITVNVNPVPSVSFSGLSPVYCSTDGPATLTGSPSGGIFTGPGITGNIFDPIISGSGNHTITYSYTNGFGCSSSFSQQLNVTLCLTAATLNLKTYLEGFYAGAGLMRTTKYDLGLSSDPAATDDITVNLWATGNLVSSIPDHSSTALLHADGTAEFQFPLAVIGNSYYIVVRHRNSVETWSKTPVLFSSTTSYDFSSGLNKAYDDGINPPMALTSGGEYAIYSGDVNQDGGIDGTDATEVEIYANLFSFGYDASDVNGDGPTDGIDASVVEINANKFIFFARP